MDIGQADTGVWRTHRRLSVVESSAVPAASETKARVKVLGEGRHVMEWQGQETSTMEGHGALHLWEGP